jgi:Flp pilus assembly protein TadG
MPGDRGSDRHQSSSICISHCHTKLQPHILLAWLSVDSHGNEHGPHAIMLLRRQNPKLRRDEGTAAVEAALIAPVLFFAIFGIIELGTAFWQWNTMLLAVEQAGRYVMVNNSSCDVSCAETQMQAVLPAASVCTTPNAGQICVNASTSASSMTLTTAYSFNLLSLFGPFTITSQGTVPLI